MQKVGDAAWDYMLRVEWEKPYFKALEKKLDLDRRHGVPVYPQAWDVFKAFDLTPLWNIRVVIIGQDPYHGEKQANGLAFSVKNTQPLPPTLKNIFKELKKDVGVEPPHGDLSLWAVQGVFLLNNVLTVEKGKPNSHAGLGWETFTDEVVKIINEEKRPIVWVLWGKEAQKKRKFLNNPQHLIIESAHPSPHSAHKGFFWSRPFSKINNFLKSHNIDPINWNFL